MHLHSTEVGSFQPQPFRHGSCCDVPVPADTFVVAGDGTIDDIDVPTPIDPSFSTFQITNAHTTDGKQRGLLFRVRGYSSGIEHNETLGNFGISSKSSIGIFAAEDITIRNQGVYSSIGNVHYFFTNDQLNPGRVTLRMALTNDGRVGIGTSNPSHKLSVVGTIDACEIIVDSFSWCDYVFEEDYERMSWKEKSKYLRRNKHLPKIASAKEIKENGLKTSETMKGMVFNIEENTLDIIDLYKIIEKQQEEIENLKAQLEKN